MKHTKLSGEKHTRRAIKRVTHSLTHTHTHTHPSTHTHTHEKLIKKRASGGVYSLSFAFLLVTYSSVVLFCFALFSFLFLCCATLGQRKTKKPTETHCRRQK